MLISFVWLKYGVCFLEQKCHFAEIFLNAALEVFKMTPYGATTDENIIKIQLSVLWILMLYLSHCHVVWNIMARRLWLDCSAFTIGKLLHSSWLKRVIKNDHVTAQWSNFWWHENIIKQPSLTSSRRLFTVQLYDGEMMCPFILGPFSIYGWWRS